MELVENEVENEVRRTYSAVALRSQYPATKSMLLAILPCFFSASSPVCEASLSSAGNTSGAVSGNCHSPCVTPSDWRNLDVMDAGWVRDAMVASRFTASTWSEDAGFQVMIKQKRPRGRKNSSLILARNLFVLRKYQHSFSSASRLHPHKTS